MNSTANPVTSDWKARAQALWEERQNIQRIQRAQTWRNQQKRRKEDSAGLTESLNKWLEDLHIPRRAKAPVTAHDGYVFTVTKTYWSGDRYALRIGKPNTWLHNIDPERYDKIFWSESIDEPGKVAEALATLETRYKNLILAQARPTPQPSLEERNPRAMLTNTERDVIAYLEYLIKRIERQQVLTDTQALVFATAQFVNSVEVITLNED